MPPSTDFEEALGQRRSKIEGSAAIFESIPAQSQADAYFEEALGQRSTAIVEGSAAIFESTPAQSQADASYVGSVPTKAKSTADWLLEVELMAQRQELPSLSDSTAVEEVTCSAPVESGEGFAGEYSAPADSRGEGNGGVAGEQAAPEREAAMLFSIAEVHLDDEAAAEALRTALASEQLFVQLGDWRSVADALRVALGAYRLQGRSEEALGLVEARLEARRAAGDRCGEVAMLLSVAEAHLLQSNASAQDAPCEGAGNDEALALARKAAKIAAKACGGDARLQASALLLQARVLLSDDRLEDSLAAAQEALRLSKAHGGDRQGEAKARHQAAEAHLASKQVQAARQCAREAHKIFHELGASRSGASALVLLCDAELAAEAPGEALKSAKAALELFRAVGSSKGQELALRRAVDAFLASGDQASAVDFARQALAGYREAGDSRGEVAALSALAAAYLAGDRHSEQHTPAEALRVAQEALAVARYLGDRRREVAALQTVADVQVLTGQLGAAAASLEAALALCRKLGDARGAAGALLALAGIHAEDSDPRRALAEAKEARGFLERAGERKKVAAALSLISGIHRSLGEFEKAEAAAGLAREASLAAGDKAGEASGLLEVAAARLECGEGRAAALRAAREAQDLLKDPGGKQERKTLEDALHWMAGVHIQSAEPEEALKLAKQGESVLRRKRASTDHEKARMKLLSTHAKLELLWQLGAEDTDPRRLRREFEGAVRTAELAVRLARPAADGALLADALHALAQTYFFGGRHEEALRAADEAAELLGEGGDRQLEVRNLALLAQAQDAAGDREVARQLWQRAAAIAEEAGDEAAAAEARAMEDQLHGAPAVSAEPPALALA